MRRLALSLGMLVVTVAGAAEQDIVPITPPAAQRVEVLGTGDEVQAVQAIDGAEVQSVLHHEPPSAAGRAASTAGKVVAGVAAAALSLGVMAASLLLF
jgi:hypothetical protein